MFILFLSLLVVSDVIFRYFIPHVDAAVIEFLNGIDAVVCFFFFVDFLWRLLAAENKWAFMKKWGWIDLAASIPYVHVLRLAKFLYVFAVIRAARSFQRVLAFIFAGNLTTSLIFSFLLFFASVCVASVAELHFEHNAPCATIKTPADAIWWALMLSTTTGDTNAVPVTVAGKIVGGGLTIIGYVLFSINAGLLISWLQRNVKLAEKKDKTGTI